MIALSSPAPLDVPSAYAAALAALREGRAATAEAGARSIQRALPGEPKSAWLLGASLAAQDKVDEATRVLETLVAAVPDFPHARVELARAYRRCGRTDEAVALLKGVLGRQPRLEAAWLAYGDVLVELRQFEAARAAYERARLADPHGARIERARAALTARDRKFAEDAFREILRLDASHVGALCGLAAVSLAAGVPKDAERLLRHAERQSAHLPLIWRGLGQALLDGGKLKDAEAAVRKLLEIEPENPQNWIVLGTVCTRLMRQADALVAYEAAVKLAPDEPRLWLSIGHLQKTLGRRDASIAAYRHCLEEPECAGEAYWSLADLKNYTFSEGEFAAMHARAQGRVVDTDDMAQLHFALGRALEQRKDYPAAFSHYATGNAQRSRTSPFSITQFEDKTRRVAAAFDATFFAARPAAGEPSRAPIFVVGLPRSGSTLVEQILASHPEVEGTFELPNVLSIVREFDHSLPSHDAYPEAVLAASRDLLGGLGRRYLAETQPLRGGRPRFIDKMPNNFSHIGLIHAILPEATIIDVRRYPMDSCFSTFKQYFAEGQSFSYNLNDLGRYYRCYLALMDHWDAVLPGRVYHVMYEDLVREPEAEIRRLLAHCGLAWDPACLSFHETRRPVRTASAEQVRQPIYSSGVGYWKHFANELTPLRDALGDALERFGVDHPAA